MEDIITYCLECTVPNHIFSISVKARSKALNQCTIQCGGCSTTQCWWEGGAVCSKPTPSCSCESMRRPTGNRHIWCIMQQSTITAVTHSPDGDSIPIPSNSTSEGEGITRTGGGRCSELPGYIACIEKRITSVFVYSVISPARSGSGYTGCSTAHPVTLLLTLIVKFFFVFCMHIAWHKTSPLLLLFSHHISHS